MESNRVRRKLAAILSADVHGYSLLMQDDETETVQTLTRYKQVMTDLITQHYGRVVDAPGDNLLAEFDSVVDAVQGAVAIQKELRVRNGEYPEHRRMRFRMGINLGDIIVEDDRIYGDGVNIASRLEGLAEPGGICISRTAFDQIEDKLPLGYEYMGEKSVKNIMRPVYAYRVLLEPEPELASRPVTEEPPRPGRVRVEEDSTAPRRRRPGRRRRSSRGFRSHARTYLSVIGLLLIINIMTWPGVLWVKWPALFWGFALFMHWRASRDEERDDRAGGPGPLGEPGPRQNEGKEYLRIQIEPLRGHSGHREKVNVRIPINILKSGAKFRNFLPRHIRERVEAALADRGFDMDLGSLEGEKLDAFLRSLDDLTVDIEKDNRRIRISHEIA